jgi:hypothetical protein
VCGKARAGNVATNDGSGGTIPTPSGTGVGHPTTGSSSGTRGGTKGLGNSKLVEAFSATPNPSAHRPPCPAPNGYWHVCYNHSGRQTWQQWVGTPLVEDDEDQLYLKGGRSILVKSVPTYAVAERAGAWGTGAEVCIGTGNWRPSVHAQGAPAPKCACAAEHRLNPQTRKPLTSNPKPFKPKT